MAVALKGKPRTWTDERTEKLIKLWECRWTSGEISRHMGISRNAVLGKVDRLKKRGQIKRVCRPVKSQPARRSTKARPKAVEKHAVQSKTVTALSVDTGTSLVEHSAHQCRYIPMDRDGAHPRPFTCDEARLSGRPYCERHQALLHVPLPKHRIKSKSAFIIDRKQA